MKKTLVLALAAIMVLGVAGAAFAESITYPLPPNTPPATVAAGTVNVKATVNPKITLTITTPAAPQTVDFGTVDPGATTTQLDVGLAVISNKKFKLEAVATPDANWTSNGLVLNRTFADVPTHLKADTGDAVWTDKYSITVPGDADPIAYTATVLYTATQI